MDSYLHYTFLIKPKYCLLKATASISSSVYIYIYIYIYESAIMRVDSLFCGISYAA